jgi:hypothetical protein
MAASRERDRDGDDRPPRLPLSVHPLSTTAAGARAVFAADHPWFRG